MVGKEGETLNRHDRWLCMMYPRLVLLKQFLREDGAIFVSIDDNEVPASASCASASSTGETGSNRAVSAIKGTCSCAGLG